MCDNQTGVRLRASSVAGKAGERLRSGVTTGDSNAPRSNRTWSLLWLPVLAAASLLVYGAGLRGGCYSDDFAYYFDPQPATLLHFFDHDNPGRFFNRPLQTTFVVIIQSLWGLETLPIHLVTLLCHLLLAWLVAVTVLRLGYSRLQGMIGSTFFLGRLGPEQGENDRRERRSRRRSDSTTATDRSERAATISHLAFIHSELAWPGPDPEFLRSPICAF